MRFLPASVLIIAVITFVVILSGSGCSTTSHVPAAAERKVASLGLHCFGVDESALQPPFALTVRKVDRAVTRAQVAQLTKAVSDVQAQIDGHLKYLSGLVMNVPWRENDNAYFQPADRTLNVPYQLSSVKEKPVPEGEPKKTVSRKHPKYTLPIVAHEYGHSVFERNVKVQECSIAQIIWELNGQRLKLEQEVQDEMNKLVDIRTRKALKKALAPVATFWANFREQMIWQHVEAVDSEKALDEAINTAKDGAAVTPEMNSEERAIMLRIQELLTKVEENAQEMRQLLEIPTGAFDELFADIVVYFQSGDPDAVSSALMAANREKKENRFTRERSFRARKSLTFRELGGAKLKTVPFGDVSYYESLNPLRNYMWKKFLSNPEYKKRPGATMAKIAEVFQWAVSDAAQDPKAFAARPIMDVNEDLMRRMDQMMPEVVGGGEVRAE